MQPAASVSQAKRCSQSETGSGCHTARRYFVCSSDDSYLGVACTPTEQTCYECYCKLAAVGFQAAGYCYKYWPKYVIQAGAGMVASTAPPCY